MSCLNLGKHGAHEIQVCIVCFVKKNAAGNKKSGEKKQRAKDGLLMRVLCALELRDMISDTESRLTPKMNSGEQFAQRLSIHNHSSARLLYHYSDTSSSKDFIFLSH